MAIKIKALEDEVFDGDDEMRASSINKSGSIRKPGPMTYD